MRVLVVIACLCWSSVQAQTFVEVGDTALGGINETAQGVSLADVDNDGDLDLFIQSYSPELLRNNFVESGSLTFTNMTSTWGPEGSPITAWSAGWADVDGDGDVDFFIGQNSSGLGDYQQNQLAQTGTPTFMNMSIQLGLNDGGFHQNVGWNDFDQDGDLDLLIAMEGPAPHQIYSQQDDGTFVASGESIGIQVPYTGSSHGKAYGTAVGDFDGDSDLDIYISTCRSGGNIRNNFFVNSLAQSGELHFADVADENGTQNFDNSYGSEFHDFDDDGDLDLLMTGADGQLSRLWRNDGDGEWTDTDTLRGAPLLSNTGGDFNGVCVLDIDNDGDLDLLFHDHLAKNGSDVARLLYRNDGDWDFTDITPTTGALYASNEGGYDSTYGDVDLDGDLDIISSTGSGFPERLFLSDTNTNGNHWLHVRLRDFPGNTTAVGATLYATIDEGELAGKTLRREANTNIGTFNQSDRPVHFGLGDASSISELRVVWPDGSESLFENVAADQHLTIEYTSTHGLVIR